MAISYKKILYDYLMFCFYCRVLRELEVIRQEATLLKEQMRLVKDDIKEVLNY